MSDLRLSPFGFLFGKSLSDLIHGIRRTAAEDRPEYLRRVVGECRDEVRSTNLNVKTVAVLKLAYLEMLGFDMSWSGFHVVEVMASPHFQQKRIGYIAAMQSFRGDQELIMLVTNLLKMDLISSNLATVSVALSGLATIVSPLLAADVADDIMKMLSHSQPYIRKKAVLALHNVVLKYPEILGVAVERIADMLELAQADVNHPDNVSVISATVSVICELATHAPEFHSFLELTPKLYAVFNTSHHNWTLIKLLKVFKLFTEREPRLKSRLLPAVRGMLSSEATSLVYESAACLVTMVDENEYELVREIIDALQSSSSGRDANLDFVFAGILSDLAKVNPRFVNEGIVRSLLVECSSDPITRQRVLKLATLVVNDDNLYDFVEEMMKQYRASESVDVANAISEIVAVNTYEYVPDFEWLVGVFAEVCKSTVTPQLSKRLVDIAVRVQDWEVRNAVSDMCQHWLATANTKEEREFADTCWWILGEFPTKAMLADPLQFVRTLQTTTCVSPTVAMCIAKFVTKASNVDYHELLDAAIEFLTPLSYSSEFELQERSCEFLELLKLAKTAPDQAVPLLYNGLASLFTAYELTPVAPGAQLQIEKPEDLDLDTPVTNLDIEIEAEDDEEEEEEPVPEKLESEEADEELVTSYTDIESEPEREEREKERQLFNLASLEIRQKERPQKKKVAIMKDSAPTTNTTKPARPVPKPASLFHSGFSRDLLDEPELEPAPVKVKHKKKHKKHAKSESAD